MRYVSSGIRNLLVDIIYNQLSTSERPIPNSCLGFYWPLYMLQGSNAVIRGERKTPVEIIPRLTLDGAGHVHSPPLNGLLAPTDQQSEYLTG